MPGDQGLHTELAHRIEGRQVSLYQSRLVAPDGDQVRYGQEDRAKQIAGECHALPGHPYCQ